MNKLYALITLTIFAACNVGDPVPTGQPDAGQTGLSPNSAVVNGTVLGRSLPTISSAYVAEIDTDVFVIVISESGDACAEEGDSGEVIAFPLLCGAPTIGDYAVVENIDLIDCTASARAVVGVFEEANGEDIGQASSGSLSIESTTAGAVAGEFSLSFGTEQLTGRFNAIVCN